MHLCLALIVGFNIALIIFHHCDWSVPLHGTDEVQEVRNADSVLILKALLCASFLDVVISIISLFAIFDCILLVNGCHGDWVVYRRGLVWILLPHLGVLIYQHCINICISLHLVDVVYTMIICF